jgi:hypothetical protein
LIRRKDGRPGFGFFATADVLSPDSPALLSDAPGSAREHPISFSADHRVRDEDSFAGPIKHGVRMGAQFPQETYFSEGPQLLPQNSPPTVLWRIGSQGIPSLFMKKL